MAFTRNSLTPIAQNGTDLPDFWIYSTADAVADVNTVDYFLEAINELSLNDVILVVSSTGTTPVHTFNIVNANDGTTIDVTDGLVITATDTD